MQCTFEQHRDTIPDEKVRVTFTVVGFELVGHGEIFQIAFFQVAKGIADDLPGGSEEIRVMYANLQESTRQNGTRSESRAVWDAP